MRGIPLDQATGLRWYRQIEWLPGVLKMWLALLGERVVLDVDTEVANVAEILCTQMECGLDIRKVQLTLSR